ncbi:MAG: ATP-binding cassette domain-containing protein, partial [Spirochaetaceae bacterium]|nr:ATP-binding cassette domain-containing protein [Spirochaetaceae bacterium]
MLTLQDVSMVFAQGTADEIRALERVNLTVRDGDFITVIGSNGAGKSTLYNVIAGTYVPTGGRILLTPAEGGPVRDITREREHLRARYIGRIFQNPLLGTAGKMTVEDNMMICHTKGYKGLKISLNNKMRSYFRERLSELNMGLENRLRDNVELLSGGQRQ